jgi:hypothetical protein
MVRFDLVFSYWLFTWYIFYIFKIVKYNPKWGLTIGLVENIGLLCLMFYYKNSWINIFLFCVVNLFIKIIPLWSIRNTKYDMNGIISFIGLFIIYLIWILLNNIPLDIKKSYIWIEKNQDAGPFTILIKKTFNL